MQLLPSIPESSGLPDTDLLARLQRRARLRKPLDALLRSRLVARLVAAAASPHDVDDYLTLFDPSWSVRSARARVVAVQPESGGAVSLFLAPNESWRGFVPGQYVRLGVSLGGARVNRCFSLSSAPHERTLRLTLEQVPGGRVSGWATSDARVGAVVELSQALGEFVLPEPLPQRLLFIAGGSGITPMRSMLLHLLHTGYRGELTCLHYARRAPIFGDELAALAARHDNFHYLPRLSRPASGASQLPSERLSRKTLAKHVPAWQESEVFVCGPTSLQAAASTLMHAAQREQHLHVESFVAATAAKLPAGEAVRCQVVFASSGRVIDANGHDPLLLQAERAGLRPAHGCRMGICHSCKCKKVSGVVRNQLTGALSSEPDEEIRLCVSTPRSNVTLDL